MLYNTNKTQSSCQAEKKNNLQLSQILGIELEIRQLNLKAPKKVKIFNTLNEYSNFHDQVFPAQATIAKKSGTSRKHVNETTTEFDYNFWITKHYSHRYTCSYKISPAFKNHQLRERLKDIIPAFRYFPKSYLISNTNRNNESFQSVEVTPIIVPLNSISISSSELATKVVCPIEKETSFYNRESVSQSFLLKEREKNEERDWRARELSNFDDVELKLHSQRKETMTQNSYSKTLMTIADKYHFTATQLEELDEFDDITLTDALKRMTGRTPNQPFTYFRSICRDIKQKQATNKRHISKPRDVSTDINKAENKYIAVHPPAPWISLSYDENIAMFAKWYDEHADGYAAYLKSTKQRIAEKFIEKLNILFQDPEKIERWRKNAIQFQEILSPYKPDELKPGSTTTKDNVVGVTMNQQIKKDSTTVKFEAETIFTEDPTYEEMLD